MTERGRAWAILLIAVVVMPMVALLISFASPRLSRGITWGSATALVATLLMALVVVLVSRVRGLTRLLGVELGNRLHRRLGVATAAFTLVHVAGAVAHSRMGIALLDPFAADPSIQTGIVAVLFMLVGGAVLPRLRSRRYGLAARLHALLGVAVLLLVGAHVVLLGDLLENPLVGIPLALLGAALLAMLLRRWVLRPLLNPGAYLVSAVRPESASTSTLVLAPAGRPLEPAPEPGQFVWLRLRRGVATTIEHPFTIAASTRSGLLELTVRHQGAFSGRLRLLERGQPVWIDGPHGAFVPTTVEPGADADGGLVLIAGGVGVTPIMSILRAHAASADPRAHSLLLAEREGERLFSAEISSLARRLDLAVLRTEGRRLDTGMLTAVLPDGRPASHQYFVCGPPPLVGAALSGLATLGVPAGSITTESFG